MNRCQRMISQAALVLAGSIGAADAALPSSSPTSYQWRLVNPSAAFSPRDGAGALVFHDKMWLLGGWTPTTTNEVWSSGDGVSWTLETAAPWEPRHCAGYVVYQDKMWIVGGDCNLGHYQNDVWNTADGIHWVQVTDHVPWGPRVLHHTVVFDGKIWVMGGQTLPQMAPAPEKFYNDVWFTTDGVTWSCATAHAEWPARGMIGGSVVLDNRMWILGGGTYQNPLHPTRLFYNDVWSSGDGVHWAQVLSAAPWEPREYHDVAVFDRRMWVMEGSHGYNLNDVWSSANGIDWTQLSGTPWPTKHRPSADQRGPAISAELRGLAITVGDAALAPLCRDPDGGRYLAGEDILEPLSRGLPRDVGHDDLVCWRDFLPCVFQVRERRQGHAPGLDPAAIVMQPPFEPRIPAIDREYHPSPIPV